MHVCITCSGKSELVPCETLPCSHVEVLHTSLVNVSSVTAMVCWYKHLSSQLLLLLTLLLLDLTHANMSIRAWILHTMPVLQTSSL